MARTQSGTNPDAIYRAVRTIKYPEGKEFISIFGPYAKPGTAKGAATHEAKWIKKSRPEVEITVVVQRAVTTWEDVT